MGTTIPKYTNPQKYVRDVVLPALREQKHLLRPNKEDEDWDRWLLSGCADLKPFPPSPVLLYIFPNLSTLRIEDTTSGWDGILRSFCMSSTRAMTGTALPNLKSIYLGTIDSSMYIFSELLEAIATWPSLRRIHACGAEEHTVFSGEMPRGETSQVTHLSLAACQLDTTSVVRLLSTLPCLKIFKYAPSPNSNNRNSGPESVKVLSVHARHSLVDLSMMPEPHGSIHVVSLVELSKLENIQLNWDHVISSEGEILLTNILSKSARRLKLNRNPLRR